MPRRLPPVLLVLIGLNVLVFLLWHLLPGNQTDLNGVMAEHFLLGKSAAVMGHPTLEFGGETYLLLEDGPKPVAAATFKPLQVLGSMFSHIQFIHLLFNMLTLSFFGPVLLQRMGSKHFIIFYLYVGLLSGALTAFFDPSPFPVLGASGAISGLLVAFAAFFPKEKIYLMFIPVGIRAFWFVLGLTVFSLVMVLLNAQDFISHFGHLMGLLAGMAYFLVRPPRSFGHHGPGIGA